MLKRIALVVATISAAYSAPALAIDTSTHGLYPASSGSWLGGAVAGYNWQRGAMVFGVEGDLSGLDLKSVTTGLQGISIYNSATAKIDWYGTLRGKLGVSNGAWLVYGTGGLAFGHVSLNNFWGTSVLGPGDPDLIGNSSSVKAGWVVGAGVDYMVNKNLVVGLQYQYVDLGNVYVAGIPGGSVGLSEIGPSAKMNAQFQVLTVSASWKFGAPPSASNSMASMSYKVKAPPPPVDPWAGAYAGAKVGGARGDRVTATPGPQTAF